MSTDGNRVMKVPVLTNSAGRDDKDFNFEIDDEVEVANSCSLTWQNELYVFGGHSQTARYQIAKVQSCRLTPIGKLAFAHYTADCVSVAGKKIVLCFNSTSADRKKCRMAASPTGAFSEMKLSQYEHKYTRIATNDGEFFKQNSVMTFSLQNLLSLSEAGMTWKRAKKLNYSMLMETTGQQLKITRLIGD